MFDPNQKKSSALFPDFLVDGAAIKEARAKGLSILLIHPRTLITPLARDLARDYNLEIQVYSPSPEVETPGNTVALGADHGGYALKETIKEALVEWKYEVLDMGCHSTNSVDYPDFAYKVASAVSTGKVWRGIMIDGVGIGSTMMANKVARVRCALCHNLFEIKNSRGHNNANMLCIGGQTLGVALSKEMVKIWLAEPFEGGRHAKRVAKIDDLDRGEPPLLPE